MYVYYTHTHTRARAGGSRGTYIPPSRNHLAGRIPLYNSIWKTLLLGQKGIHGAKKLFHNGDNIAKP